MSRGGSTYYYLTDGLGSVTDLTSAAGAVIESYTYDVYGAPSATSTVGNPYYFAGRRLDPESGIYDYRYRNYDQRIGRFVQRDPIGYYDSMNLYQFVLNSPINWWDPYGLFVFDAQTEKKYPKTVQHINSMKPSNKAVSAFKKFGQATQKDIDKAFTPCDGPDVNVTSLTGAYGEFSPGINSNTLKIDTKLFENFEKGAPGSQLLLEATLQHELTHFFDDQDGADYPGEEGELFEINIYGRIIH